MILVGSVSLVWSTIETGLFYPLQLRGISLNKGVFQNLSSSILII